MGGRASVWAALGAVTVAAALLAATPPVVAEPEPGPLNGREETHGNGPDRNERAALTRQLQTPGVHQGVDRKRGYPRRNVLPVPPVVPDDRSIKLGLVPYHGIAARLNELQRLGDRVSAEVVGRSAQGRDLYLVTVTAPESAAEAARQEAMREKIENDAARAAGDRRIAAGYKAPVFVNANIHGDEWEGTDAVLRIVGELATATDRATAELLGSTRLYFHVTANPDGRVAGARTNGNGFDLNRDFVTASQPEVRAMRQIVIDTQPVVMLDLHGYVNGTLIEPTTPPHGQNYEYDLFIRNAYDNALGMEAAVKALGTGGPDGVLPPQIPFRDSVDGWDDWPPIFAPQYAPFHGAVASHTVEIPLQVNGGEYTARPESVLRRRAAFNTGVAAAATRAALAFTSERRADLVADQIEVFRRGAAGEPRRNPPIGEIPGWGPEDVYSTVFPRAYVIPSGAGQESAVAAARLVDHLVANDVGVERTVRDVTVGARRYPAGSYVVDMHQPKRGLANVMLEPGRDISGNIEAMYDISGWSHAQLWGATVDPVQGPLPRLRTVPVTTASPTGDVAGKGDLALRLGDGREIAALNDLLAAGAELRLAGASAVLPARRRKLAVTLADRYGVRFRPAAAPGEIPLRRLRIAAAAGPDELFTLREMGFEVIPVSTASLNAGGFDWSATDVLYVSSGLSYTALTPAARSALDGFLPRAGVVGRGSTGSAFNAATGLLPVTSVAGRRDANGVVRVTGQDAPPYSFVYSPRWFTGLGPGVTAVQSYATDGPLVSGHWRAGEDGRGGPADAAGQAAVVRGTAGTGAAVVLFGTEPLFRNHPKGLFAQVGLALHWTAAMAAATAPR
ncbi:M14 family zinc carboxypeptidase [Spongiactinospora sp. TRM90649]|uniref:M14 family zinc carboxypeptidase n=1 Tax=Spongiactinospora sp. TRM90649 TaxID=3031114 RepID=UPI0023F7DC71|nr:M14 family zinc carboxypeptidase [Spongiactinospora sp. TRM90649]MDF5757003.1 M14 family zinc carboxypeptidase [Spongiactinospora sp. TRM90649]